MISVVNEIMNLVELPSSIILIEIVVLRIKEIIEKPPVLKFLSIIDLFAQVNKLICCVWIADNQTSLI
jgi:hypothetical protein